MSLRRSVAPSVSFGYLRLSNSSDGVMICTNLFRFQVSAEDVNAPSHVTGSQKTKTEQLSIKVGDRPPQFFLNKYRVHVPESAAPNFM